MNRQILIVDDNENNRMTIELQLENFEHITIHHATNGQQAVDYCRKNHVDLVFMDIMMPVMDGIEATRKIREFDPKVMIIAISALDDDESKKIMIRNGCEDYIHKPINSIVFNRRVENYLELIELRGKQVLSENVCNLFTNEVYSRTLSFHVSSKKGLAEFWEYYLTDSDKDILDISDCIRITYALTAFVLEAKKEARIISEENEKAMFLTLCDVHVIGEKTVRNILQKHYPEGRYVLDSDKISFMLDKVVPVRKPVEKETVQTISSEEKEILRKTHSEKITAREFVETTPISLCGKIEELEVIEDELDREIILFEQDKRVQRLHTIGQKYLTYAYVIEGMIEFQHLAYSIMSFANMLTGLTQDKINDDNSRKLSLFLDGILQDIAAWRTNIFIDKETNDIHYLDSSLLSSCLQIEMVFEYKSIETADSDLELF